MHTIRLRGPWQLEPEVQQLPKSDGTHLLLSDGLPPSARATMPADWSQSFGADFLGLVRYHRVFQKPTGLDSGERVFLVVEPPRSRGVVKIGGRFMGEVTFGEQPARFDITDDLQDHNHLEILVEHPFPKTSSDVSPSGGLVGEVRLEIEER